MSKVPQDFASQQDRTAVGRETHIAVARQERKGRGLRTGVAFLASAALIGLGVKLAPEDMFHLDDPAAHETGTTQVGDLTPGIHQGEPLQMDKNGMPYVPEEQDK